MIEFIDVHCHLDDEAFSKDLNQVIDNAKKVNVIKIITSALNFDSIRKTVEIIKKYKGYVFYTVALDYGILDEKKVIEITNYIKENKEKIVGIGEVGLDFYIFRKEKEKENQRKIFKHWIELSKELNLPLVVHSRSAGKYAIKMLIENEAEKVLMHAFDGSVGYAIEGKKKGYYFSIPPSIVRSNQKQKLVKHLPLENLMLESDAPVLGPNKEIRNAPSNVIISAKKISEIKKIPLEEVAKITTFNANNLFFKKHKFK